MLSFRLLHFSVIFLLSFYTIWCTHVYFLYMNFPIKVNFDWNKMKRVRSQRAGDLYDLHYEAICFSVVNNFYKFGHYCKIVRHPFLNTKQNSSKTP